MTVLVFIATSQYSSEALDTLSRSGLLLYQSLFSNCLGCLSLPYTYFPVLKRMLVLTS